MRTRKLFLDPQSLYLELVRVCLKAREDESIIEPPKTDLKLVAPGLRLALALAGRDFEGTGYKPTLHMPLTAYPTITRYR